LISPLTPEPANALKAFGCWPAAAALAIVATNQLRSPWYEQGAELQYWARPADKSFLQAGDWRKLWQLKQVLAQMG